MNSSFTASAYLVKTEKRSDYDTNAPRAASFAARTEKKAIARKRFRPPGDGRFFDAHH